MTVFCGGGVESHEYERKFLEAVSFSFHVRWHVVMLSGKENGVRSAMERMKRQLRGNRAVSAFYWSTSIEIQSNLILTLVM